MAETGGQKKRSQFARLYRTLQVLRIHHDVAFGQPIAATKLPFVLLIIRGLYGAVSGEGAARVAQAVGALSAWLYLQVAYKTLGNIHESSNEAVKMWSKMNQNPWFARFLRSCKPLKFEVTGFYFVDKGMPLTLANIIVTRTVDLLIAGK